MKKLIGVLICVSFSACHSQIPTASEPVYINALAVRNALTCPWPEDKPRVESFVKLYIYDVALNTLMREKIEIVRRENQARHVERFEERKERRSGLFKLPSDAQLAQEFRVVDWDEAAAGFISDQHTLDAKPKGMEYDLKQIDYGLRMYIDDPKRFSSRFPTDGTLTAFVDYLAGSYSENCMVYLSTAKLLSERDGLLTKLREEKKKPWLESRFHLPCEISRVEGCILDN